MDVNDLIRVLTYKLPTENPHVPCQHYTINAVLLESLQYLVLSNCLGTTVHIVALKRYTKSIANWPKLCMVAHNHGDGRLKLTNVLSQQEVVNAVFRRGYEDGRLANIV